MNEVSIWQLLAKWRIKKQGYVKKQKCECSYLDLMLVPYATQSKRQKKGKGKVP